MISLGLSFELNLDDWFVISSTDYLEWPVFHVLLNNIIMEFSSDESLCIKDSVFWIFGNLVLGSVSDQSLIVGEPNIRWGGSVTLVIGNNFNSVVHVYSDTRVSSS